MPGYDDLDAHFSRALHDCLKIVDLEPEQHPVSIWLIVTIANRAVMVFYVEAVQLKNKLAIRDQLFVRRRHHDCFGSPADVDTIGCWLPHRSRRSEAEDAFSQRINSRLKT